MTNTGPRAGADVAQLYVTDPSASGQPPRQLEGFARVSLAAGASQTVTFPLTQQNLQYWNTSSNSWATPAGSYGIKVGDSDANLPLSGTLSVSSAQLGQPVTITSPGPQEGLAGTARDGNGALASTSFTWTVLPSGDDIATTPLTGYEGLCLDDTGFSITPGTQVQIWSCTGSSNQSWVSPAG